MRELASAALTGLDPGGGAFCTTQWTVVLLAREMSAVGTTQALERLCRDYWPPLYAYIRREGHPIEDARDLTQEFFAKLLEKDWLRHLRHQEGKFRSFLLTLLKHFLADQRDRAAALKRGGGRQFIALDQLEGEERERLEPADHLTPDQAFDRRWLGLLNERAVERLRDEYETGGKGHLFEEFKNVQRGAGNAETQVALGARLGMSAAAVKSALHRFHRRHSELVREEAARTVTRPEAVTGELRHLLEAFSG